MNQRELFVDGVPVAHSGDPETSHEAARQITASGCRGRHAQEVLALVTSHPGCTACELLAHTTLAEYQVRRRLTDLFHAGLVAQGPARRCGAKGTQMVTWFNRVQSGSS